MITKIVNLTKHQLVICPEGYKPMVIESSGEVRAVFRAMREEGISIPGEQQEISIYKFKYSEIIGLDLIKNEPNTVYYLSRYAAEAIKAIHPGKYDNIVVANERVKDPKSGDIMFIRSVLKL